MLSGKHNTVVQITGSFLEPKLSTNSMLRPFSVSVPNHKILYKINENSNEYSDIYLQKLDQNEDLMNESHVKNGYLIPSLIRVSLDSLTPTLTLIGMRFPAIDRPPNPLNRYAYPPVPLTLTLIGMLILLLIAVALTMIHFRSCRMKRLRLTMLFKNLLPIPCSIYLQPEKMC